MEKEHDLKGLSSGDLSLILKKVSDVGEAAHIAKQWLEVNDKSIEAGIEPITLVLNKAAARYNIEITSQYELVNRMNDQEVLSYVPALHYNVDRVTAGLAWFQISGRGYKSSLGLATIIFNNLQS